MKFRILLLISLAVACRKPAYIYRPPTPNPSPADANDRRILLMVFHIKAGDDGKNVITLVSKNFASGKLKSGETAVQNSAAAIIVSQIDAASNTLQTSVIDHPLYKSTEYLKEQGEFARKQLMLKEADFFVRLTLLPGAAGVQLEEIQNNKKVNSIMFEIQ